MEEKLQHCVIESDKFIEHMSEHGAKDIIVDINKDLEDICYRLGIDYDPSYISMFFLYEDSMKKEIERINDKVGEDASLDVFSSYLETVYSIQELVANIKSSLIELVKNYKTTIDTLITGNSYEESKEPEEGLCIPFKRS